ncbi:DUF4177 domain-containing protein [Lysinibacillus sphaericus]|uniref:DUF4177 domain-containing protein n=1 Tax=Lysinibacillus sphaericus TaxID=1421 RepID=UPI001910A845|nr:DUF4177 domain-containing protein [Lysinibacillus sphaericus]QPA56295.1 DUF4177 domain-containing protein [Lysinibacillus sphaericus]
MKKWEYQVVDFEETINDSNLNNLRQYLDDSGFDGWELASIVPKSSEKGDSVVIVLKREDLEED